MRPGPLGWLSVAFVVAWLLSPREGGIEQRGYDPWHIPAPFGPSIGRQAPWAAYPFTPAKLRQSGAGRPISALDLPGSERGAPVADGVQVTPALMHLDGYQFFGLDVRGVGGFKVGSDGDELCQARNVTRIGVTPSELQGQGVVKHGAFYHG